MENPTTHSPFMHIELWPEILKRLPTKSLSRFRCVSRSWNSLIRSPSFIADHHAAGGNTNTHLFLLAELSLHPYASEQHFLIDLKSPQTGFTSLHPPKPTQLPPSVTILAASNGLLLGAVQSENATHHILCNPMIHKYVVLPKPEPDSVMCRLGFGYDPQKNDFGVVKINYDVNPLTRMLNSPPTATVCYARERAWKPVNGDLLSLYAPSQCPNKQCCINGRVYWLVSLIHEIRFFDDHLLVFSFESERFERLDLPLQADGLRCGIQLLSSKQNLSVMYALEDKYTLWSYSEGRSWAKVMCFDRDPSMGVVYTVVYLGGREDGDGKMVVSDCDEGKCREVLRVIRMGGWEIHHVSGFDESLFLLDEETQALPISQLVI